MPGIGTKRAMSIRCRICYCSLSIHATCISRRHLCKGFASLTLTMSKRRRAPVRMDLVIPTAFLTSGRRDHILLTYNLRSARLQLSKRRYFTLRTGDCRRLVSCPFRVTRRSGFSFVIRSRTRRALPRHFCLSNGRGTGVNEVRRSIARVYRACLS